MIRKLSVLTLLGCASVAAFAQTIENPSFELNTFGTWPGYQAGANNGPITGWTSTGGGNTTDPLARSGINADPATWDPPNANATPFLNNGIIPNGTKVGFIQVTGLAGTPTTTTLSNTVSGLTPGESYRLTFNFNARHNNTPNGIVTIGGNTLNFRANAVEAAPNRTLPFRTASVVFTATAPAETFSVSNFAPGAGDSTLLIDNFQVAPGSTKWRVTPWADDATSGIDPARSYTHAYNLGSDVATSINGVNFTPIIAPNPAAPGSFSTTGWTTVIGADDVNQLTAAGGGSAEMGRRFVYGGAAQATQSITLEGLTPGVPNHLILYGVGWSDAGAIARSMTFSDGAGDIATLNEHLLGVDQGVKIEFDYVPTGTSQTFTLTPTASTTTFHLYGFANSIVPEPSAFGLLGAGALLVGRRRRRA